MMEILKLEGITKQYPGVVALSNVDFSLGKGEICALLGKNGAGKSTLVKILSGAVLPDCGTILINGRVVHLSNPRDAFRIGISTVYQEMSLVPNLGVGENILLGRWKTKKILGLRFIDRKRINDRAQESMRKLNVRLPLNKKVSELNIAQKQICEIAKAISFSPSVLILDEPTSALTSEEVTIFHKVLNALRSRGHSIIYVTHRLQEVPLIADKVTVLRDGILVGTVHISETTPAKIVRMMVGNNFSHGGEPRTGNDCKKVLLSVDHLGNKHLFRNISFKVHKGEILGIAGLLGSGRTELMRSIIGLDPYDCGSVTFEGSEVGKISVRKMKALKIDMLPEDRKRSGFVPFFSVRNNLTLSCLDRVSRRGVLSKKRERKIAGESIRKLSIKATNQDTPVFTLSGGNQQKVVLGKCLNILPKLLILDEPTRGIDIQAKEQIYRLLKTLSEENGISMIFISSEIEEVLQISDRVIVMREGRFVSDVDPQKITIEELTDLVVGE